MKNNKKKIKIKNYTDKLFKIIKMGKKEKKEKEEAVIVKPLSRKEKIAAIYKEQKSNSKKWM